MLLCPDPEELRAAQVCLRSIVLCAHPFKLPFSDHNHVGCRQVKLACDAQSRTPCTRCRERHLECRFDANFKRIATRTLARKVTTEISNLQALADASSPYSKGSTSSQLPHIQLNGHSPEPEPVLLADIRPSDIQSGGRWLQIEPSLEPTSFISGDTAMPEEVILELFSQ